MFVPVATTAVTFFLSVSPRRGVWKWARNKLRERGEAARQASQAARAGASAAVGSGAWNASADLGGSGDDADSNKV